ncbi:MAG: response regulator, partial [Okeania sp. SIO3B3]|nr:response regulator [Okeania sp. SIO3B3]
MSYTSTILIVDDEASARDALEAVLTGQNYNLVFAHNGPEALVKANNASPDVILLDVMMPDMNGFEVCARLRSNQ